MTDQRLEDEDQRAFGNVVLLVAVAALIGGGIWIASVMLDVRQVRDCAAAGGQLRADSIPPRTMADSTLVQLFRDRPCVSGITVPLGLQVCGP
jgi:hypothetical protein